MKELLAELSQLDIHSFSVNLNKQISSTLVIFDYRKKITVEELFDTISRNCHDLSSFLFTANQYALLDFAFGYN